jgi:hypothetical protein
MFGNRKRKPEDDEESLVPHGLIWHATAEPAAEDKDSLEHTVQYAQGIERARRPQLAPEPEHVPEVAQAPSEASAPLPWWRVQRPEPEPDRPISKPTLLPLSAYAPTLPVEPNLEPPRVTQFEAPRIQSTLVKATQIQPIQIQPIQVQPAPVQPIQIQPTQVPEARAAQILQIPVPPVQEPRIQSPQAPPFIKSEVYKPQVQKAEVSDIAPVVPKVSQIAEMLLRSISRLRSSGRTAWLAAVSTSAKVRQHWLHASESIEFRQIILRAGKRGQSLMRDGITRINRYAQTTGSVVSVFSRTGLARLQRLSARVSSASMAGRSHVLRPANTQPSSPSRARTRLATSASRAKVFAAQRLSAWKMKRDGMAIDSRFWSSMTLSAIAALIVLAIVSMVPHYAAKSLPSQILNTNPSVSASVAAPVTAPAPHAEKTTPRKTGNAQPAQEKPVSRKTAATPATTPKPHRAADDDYVAPNTYKYYGNGSKASR